MAVIPGRTYAIHGLRPDEGGVRRIWLSCDLHEPFVWLDHDCERDYCLTRTKLFHGQRRCRWCDANSK